MSTDFRALCAELLRIWDKMPLPAYQSDWASVIARTRYLLAKPADAPAAPPAEGEVAELVAWLRENAEYSDYQADPEDAVMFRRAAELLERHAAPVPVPVAEGLPGLEDCDAEGRCWLHGKVEGDWRLINPAKSGVPHLRYCFSHWLPASALPLPLPQGGETQP